MNKRVLEDVLTLEEVHTGCARTECSSLFMNSKVRYPRFPSLDMADGLLDEIECDAFCMILFVWYLWPRMR